MEKEGKDVAEVARVGGVVVSGMRPGAKAGTGTTETLMLGPPVREAISEGRSHRGTLEVAGEVLPNDGGAEGPDKSPSEGRGVRRKGSRIVVVVGRVKGNGGKRNRRWGLETAPPPSAIVGPMAGQTSHGLAEELGRATAGASHRARTRQEHPVDRRPGGRGRGRRGKERGRKVRDVVRREWERLGARHQTICLREREGEKTMTIGGVDGQERLEQVVRRGGVRAPRGVGWDGDAPEGARVGSAGAGISSG